MASSSGNGRDKGKRPLSGVLSCFCFKPKTSEDSQVQQHQPSPSNSDSSYESAPDSLLDSFPASPSPLLEPSTSAPQSHCRLMINHQHFAKRLGEGKYGVVYEGLVINSNKKNEGRHSKLIFGDSLIGSFEMWTRAALKVVNEQGMKVISSWLSEVKNHGNLNSPHFVKLIAITEYIDCDGMKATVLVYEFMPNKSLKERLYNDSPCRLTWDLRVKIALHAAEGLLYLHQGMETKMVYGEFKASNILLDVAFTPKLAFFGLSRSKEVAGSSTGPQPDDLDAENDVHMFGRVLFELLRGLSPVNTSALSKDVLELLKMGKEGDDYLDLYMDTRLEEYPKEANRELIRLAANCLTEDRTKRPKMSEVVKVLQQVIR